MIYTQVIGRISRGTDMRSVKYFFLLAIILLLAVTPLAAQDTSAYETALARIEAVRATNFSTLNLRDLGLQELPPEVGTLTQLEILMLDRNELTALPPQ